MWIKWQGRAKSIVELIVTSGLTYRDGGGWLTRCVHPQLLAIQRCAFLARQTPISPGEENSYEPFPSKMVVRLLVISSIQRNASHSYWESWQFELRVALGGTTETGNIEGYPLNLSLGFILRQRFSFVKNALEKFGRKNLSSYQYMARAQISPSA